MVPSFVNSSWLTARAVAVAALVANAASTSILGVTPAAFSNASAVFIKDHLAVLPAADWNVPTLATPFFGIQTNDTALQRELNRVLAADFIALDERFFDVIGPSSKLEIIASFPGIEGHVHEAPTYIADTDQLLFSDTSQVGSLYLLDVATNKLRNITVTPALHNVNGGTYHRGTIYVTTNGSPVRGVYTLQVFPNDTAIATPVVNNYRGRKLNSPNDIIADRNGNLWFTDPAYGWYNQWPGVGAPELPNAVYFFNTTSKALVAVTNDVVLVPNGLALSPDGHTLYVSDTNATSGRPSMNFDSSVRNIIAFDMVNKVSSGLLSSGRFVYQTDAGVPDGFRVSASGLIFAGAGDGVDVVDPTTGVLLGKINTPNDNVFNVQFVPGTGTLFIMSTDHVRKVTLREIGL